MGPLSTPVLYIQFPPIAVHIIINAHTFKIALAYSPILFRRGGLLPKWITLLKIVTFSIPFADLVASKLADL